MKGPMTWKQLDARLSEWLFKCLTKPFLIVAPYLRTNYWLDGQTLTVKQPFSRCVSVPIEDFDEIGVETTDQGPFVEDVFWILKRGDMRLRIGDPHPVFKMLMEDINEEVLAVARSKPIDSQRVTFRRDDAYALPVLPQRFTGGFSGFWWSHVPKARIQGFLRGFHRVLSPGARVVFIDNAYVEGSSTPISRVDEQGDTWQVRHLEDGSTHEVRKNFPTEPELRASMKGLASDVRVDYLRYYWILSYMTNPTFTTIRTVRTAVEAGLALSLLRNAGFHPVEISTSSHFSVAGVDISYPIEVPVSEAVEARKFLEAYSKPEGSG
jgi:demethylmenaquinone methyltransferase/2-methoxy-6-polyprenyl-1,4-benzoquinol methylase